MLELIERLEKAKAGSRELDALVWAATHGLGIDPIMAEHLAGVCAAEDGTPVVAEAVTTSLDAIVGLIGEKLPGAVWHVATDYGLPGRAKIGPVGRPSASIYKDEDAPQFVVEDGETPALALCIALLRALSRDNGNGGGEP